MLLLPWSAYQKFYDPPGDRLIKMHLGGIVPLDPRPAIPAIIDAYANAPLGGYRQQDIQRPYGGRRIARAWIRRHGRADRPLDRWRVREREGVTAALGVATSGGRLLWWWRANVTPRDAAMRRNAGALLGLAAISAALWCLFMFGPGATVTTHEAYAVELALFVVLGAAIAELRFSVSAAVLALAVPNLMVTWIVGSLPDAWRGVPRSTR